MQLHQVQGEERSLKTVRKECTARSPESQVRVRTRGLQCGHKSSHIHWKHKTVTFVNKSVRYSQREREYEDREGESEII